MNEASAREVVLVQAIESADAARSLWSDADRIEASQAAARELGQSAALDAWVARRAAITLARLRPRARALDALARAPLRWGTLAVITAAVAFIAGLGVARIGPSQRINLLAPPLAALLAWNLMVYLLLASMGARGWIRRRDRPSHRLRERVARFAAGLGGEWRRSVGAGPLAAAAAAFTVNWTRLAMPLSERRAACLLHAGAALLAGGAIAGLYVRGLALEYRAVWQSTFLDATAVAALLHVVLAPGAFVTGFAIPGAAELARLGPGSAGENAARWIHLYAGTLLVVVIVPRLVLAAVSWVGASRAAQRFPLGLETPYFRRLARAWHSGTVRVRVAPYSFEAPARSRAGLEAVLARAFETPVHLAWVNPVRYGDDPPPASDAGVPTVTVALFNLSATPELENHVAFVSALAEHGNAAAPPIVIVDVSEFAARFHAQPTRISERELAWRETFESAAMMPIFMRLAAPDLVSDSASLAAVLEREAG